MGWEGLGRLYVCWLCGKERSVLGPGTWCPKCSASYDRMRAKGDGTCLASIRWAVKRALSQRRKVR